MGIGDKGGAWLPPTGVPQEPAEQNKKEQQEVSENKVEQETVGPMTVIYRDNALFEEYIPIIEKYIKSLGGEINLQSFPRGTDADVIKNWYESNGQSLEGRVLLTDETCYPTQRLNESIASKQGKLDEILNEAFLTTFEVGVQAEIGDGKIFNSSGELVAAESFDVVFLKVFKSFFENKEKYPQEIMIITNHIGDHIYSHMWEEKERELFGIKEFKFRDLLEGESEEKYKKERSLEFRNVFQKEEERMIAEKFKQYLVEAGFPEEKISIEETQNYNKVDKKDSWILVDRHSEIMGLHGGTNIDHFHNATALVLPFSNLLKSASEQGLLFKLPPEKIAEKLYPVLDSYFKKKEE